MDILSNPRFFLLSSRNHLKFPLTSPKNLPALNKLAFRQYNISPNKLPDTSKTNYKQNTVVNDIDPYSKPLPSLTSFVSGSKAPPTVEPAFEKVESTKGSLTLARFPSYSKYTFLNGNIAAKSPSLKLVKKYNGFSLLAFLRTLIGSKLTVTELSSNELPGDAVIAPLTPGDIAEIKLNGSTSYYINKNSLLGYSSFVSLNSASIGSSSTLSLGKVFSTLKVSGTGSFLMNSDSGLFKISLEENEQYCVDSDYVICWDSQLQAAPVASHSNTPGWLSSSMSKLFTRKNKTTEPPKTEKTPEIQNLTLESSQTKPIKNSDSNTSNTSAPTDSTVGNTQPIQNKPAADLPVSKWSSQWMASILKQMFFNIYTWIKNMFIKLLNGIYNLFVNLLRRLGLFLKHGINIPKLVVVKGPGDIFLTSSSTNSSLNKLKRTFSSRT
ncbi:hypothetical protein BB560_002044 [Smittium megazygosporum]|uniref:Altered inheritance of mitochondria protein 24, mitochondrial n=1 Tax=Smittium megazygosporum TaxID=133381 RepID=A0A2T9ZFV8_9FUNG|nr:hypothetical protein BB560_002044 [Smittium megazygosporum]